MALTASPQLCYPLGQSRLRRDRNSYDFHDSPNNVEDRRKDDAYEQENKGVIEYALHKRYALRCLDACGFFTHGHRISDR